MNILRLKKNKVGANNTAQSSQKTGQKTGLSLRSKLLLMLLGAGMSAVLVISYLGYQHGEKQLTQAAFKQLTALRSGKQQQIEWYFDSLRSMIRVLGDTPTVGKAMDEFTKAFKKLGKTTTNKFVPVMSTEQKDALENFYKTKYFRRLDQLSHGKSNVEIFWPRSPAGRKAQSLYIAENPHKIDEKLELNNSGNGTEYDKIHSKYHGFFRNTISRLKLYDIYLIDGDTGAIVYSVDKQADFGTGLLNGPYAHTSLGRLFHDIRANHRRGRVLMKDYVFYPPSYNAPAAFIGTPVYGRDGTFTGVLAAQLSVDELNKFMTNNENWEKDGLGKSGEVYLVGEDRLMRSNLRFLAQDKKAYLAALNSAHTRKATIDRIERLNTSVLLQRVNTHGVSEAFRGETDTKAIDDYRGVKVISSYAPLDIPDLRWVMLAEINEAEARAPQYSFARNVLLTSGALLLALTLASLIIASKFLKPISVLVDGIHRIRGGEKDVSIPKLANDEFGELSDTFNSLTDEIDQRDKIIEHQAASYDDLLCRMYPENIVERLKKGEANIVESLHQVSVVYMIVHGFSKQTSALDSVDIITLLNDIVDTLDDCCKEHGVEKVKTIGEHYLAVCGLTVPRLDHARRALEFAHAASREIAIFNARYDLKLALRVGIHSGPLHSGIVGSHDFSFDIWGNSLNIARRIVFETGFNKMRITTHTYHLLNSTEDFGPEEVIKTKAVGKVVTFEQDLDTTLDKNRVEKKKSIKRSQVSNGKTPKRGKLALSERLAQSRKNQKNTEHFDNADDEFKDDQSVQEEEA